MKPRTLLITADDCATIVCRLGLNRVMDDLIGRIEEECRSPQQEPDSARARDGFHYSRPHVGLLEWMPSLKSGGGVTIKTVGYHPENPARYSLPTIISTLAHYDVATGHLIGIADGTLMTAMRTAAASAVASRILARPRSSVVGLIGCGAQAVTQLHALTRLFDIKQVLIHDTSPGALGSFAERIRTFTHGSVDVQPTAPELLAQAADILCTSTSVGVGEGPVFSDVRTRDWLHVNAVGSDFSGKFEIPKTLLERSLVCPDHLEQAIREGESQQLPADGLGPDLVTLVRDAERYADYRETLTVFDSTGWAIEDNLAMSLLLDYSRQLGIGQEVAIELLCDDPLNPYGFVSDETGAGARSDGSVPGN